MSVGLVLLRVFVLVILVLMLGNSTFRTEQAGGTSNMLLGTSLIIMVFTVGRQIVKHDDLGLNTNGSEMSFSSVMFAVQRLVPRFVPVALFLAICKVGLGYFTSNQYDVNKTPAQSRDMNGKCTLFGFFDNHDIWHVLSAIALAVWVLLLLDIRIRIWKHHRQIESESHIEHIEMSSTLNVTVRRTI